MSCVPTAPGMSQTFQHTTSASSKDMNWKYLNRSRFEFTELITWPWDQETQEQHFLVLFGDWVIDLVRKLTERCTKKTFFGVKRCFTIPSWFLLMRKSVSFVNFALRSLTFFSLFSIFSLTVWYFSILPANIPLTCNVHQVDGFSSLPQYPVLMLMMVSASTRIILVLSWVLLWLWRSYYAHSSL